MGRLLFISFLLTGLSACATFTPVTPEEAVLKRSEKRLMAFQKNDLKQAYGFMSPGYRSTTSLRFFEADNIGMTMMKGYEILGASCEEILCNVSMNVRFNLAEIGVMGGMRNNQVIDQVTDIFMQETWIYVDGKWWASGK